jgi:hypothetical protein
MLLATACGSSHPTTTPTTASTLAPATIPSAPTTVPASTTTAPDTAVVPAHITVAYVDAVLVQLNHVYGDAVRELVEAKRLTPRAIADLNSIYTTALGAEEQSLFGQALAERLPNVRALPGDPITSVQKLVFVSKSCIYARVQTDSDPIVVHPVPPLADEFMGLRHPATARGLGTNHTPWIFFFDGVTKTPANIANQCVIE